MEPADNLTFTLLFTSDIHGHLYPTDYRSHQDLPLGLAKLSVLIERERKLNPQLMLIDNGDLLQGTPLMYHYAKYNRTGMNPAILVLNHLQYDAAVPGNHEFNYGLPFLRQAVKESNFPWLSANCLDMQTGQPLFGQPYLIQQAKRGLKVAILGLTTHFVPNWENPSHIQGLAFDDALQAAKKWVEHIRNIEAPDVMVVAYHGGFERDLESGEAAEALSGENQAYIMCAELEGVDVLLTGHQHRLLTDELNGVTILQPGSNGVALGKINLQLVKRNEKWLIAHKSALLLMPDDTVQADRRILKLCEPYERLTQQWLDQPMGETKGDMRVHDPLSARLNDHPFIEFINRVQMNASGADLSCAAIFTDDAPGFGPLITMRDIVSNYKYPNTLKVLRLKGQDIADALEKSANYFMIDGNGKPAVNPDYTEPKVQHYNYDMWEGIEYVLDITRPPGQRLAELTIGGQPLDREGDYDVVMNSYRASGGGDYEMFRGKPVIRDIPVDMTELIADYISERKRIEAVCDHNWKVVF